MYIAILPDTALGEAGGDANELLAMIANALRRDGTYAAVTGGRFRAGSTVLERGEAARLATEAFDESKGRGLAATLEDFVGRVADARKGGGSAGDGGSGTPTGLLVLFGLVAAGGGLFALSNARRRRRERDEQVAELREAADDDLVALGEDVRSVDLDVEMPNADPRARAALGRALEAYDEANELLHDARRPEDFGRITETIAEGRQAMAETRAHLDGREPPPARPPCFFDPRHGPSSPRSNGRRTAPRRGPSGLRRRRSSPGGRPGADDARGAGRRTHAALLAGAGLLRPLGRRLLRRVRRRHVPARLLTGTLLGGSLFGPDIVRGRRRRLRRLRRRGFRRRW
jgi:hypothetical protein